MTDVGLLLDDPVERVNALTEWGDDDIIEWLGRGFATLDSADRPSQVRDAFKPVEIYPHSEPIAQLASAILEEDLPRLPTVRQVEAALRRHLVSGEAVAGGDWALLTRCWQLLSALPLAPDVTATARQFLNQLMATSQGDIEALVRAVAATVAIASPVTNQQISFFEHLWARFRDLWSADLTLVAVDLTFEKAAEDRRQGEPVASSVENAWAGVQSQWRNEMIDMLRRGDGTSRALLRTLARHMGDDPDSIDPAELIARLTKEKGRRGAEAHLQFEKMVELAI